MSTSIETPSTTQSAPFESPPLSAMPARDSDPVAESRARLHQLADELARTHNRKLLTEYLRLRRSLR